MKTTIIALSVAAFTVMAMGTVTTPVFAAAHMKAKKDVPCKPAKKGYVMVKGKCVKKKKK